jgi:8-oxo-dGTP pyrophosphatase MutT (NUDIX family)
MTGPRKLLEATLLFPVTATKVGLGLKKQKIGAGRRNGWGGIVDPGEDEYAGVVREVFEEGEILIDPATLAKAAVILFHNEKFDCRVHAFLCQWEYGLLRETGEMGPHEWHDRFAPPTAQMMLADAEWVPRILAGENLVGEVWYSQGQKTLLKPSIFQAVLPEELPRLRLAA